MNSAIISLLRKALRIIAWTLGVTILSVVALVGIYFVSMLTQPTWEVRVEGPEGTKFQACAGIDVRIFPFIHYPISGLLANGTVPYTFTFQAMDLSQHFTVRSPGKVIMVMTLKDGRIMNRRRFPSGETFEQRMRRLDP